MINEIKKRIKLFDVNSMNIRDLLYLFRLLKELEEYEYMLEIRKHFDKMKFAMEKHIPTPLDKEDYD